MKTLTQVPKQARLGPWTSRAIHVVVIAMLLAAGPFMGGGAGSIAILVCVYGVYALGYEVLFGFTNQASLGQSLFFGMGAYTVALMVQRFHQGLPLAVLLAIVLSAAVACLVGLVTVRLTEAYFVIATALFGSIVYLLANDLAWLTGGSNGLPFELPAVHVLSFQLSFYDQQTTYYLVVVTIILCYLLVRRIRGSKLGMVWISIRENERRFPFLGYHLAAYKLAAFVLAGALTGLAGALYAVTLSYVSVGFFNLAWAIWPIVWCLLGGSGTVIGPILGAGIMVLFQYYVSPVFPNYMLIVGVILILLMRGSAKGLIGYAGKAISWGRRAFYGHQVKGSRSRD